ncbi:thioredoxin family protein [Mycoplasmopsis sturni]|uniref:thioredoxin family protein n=1 Tax=Mycoplasmopsis sturni TaxID=39047 RepID=UPI0005600935|nr:thioredoxin family protein [Mycoplasmopsis sturni]
MLKDVTKTEVMQEIKSGLHLVVFHATWCGACRMFKSTLDELAEKDGISVLRVDIDQDKNYAIEEKVQSIPYTLVYKDGQLVEKLLGFRPYDQIKAELAKYL